MSEHPQVKIERDRALADIMQLLYSATQNLMRAREINLQHGLGIDMPHERIFTHAIDCCERVYKGKNNNESP